MSENSYKNIQTPGELRNQIQSDLDSDLQIEGMPKIWPGAGNPEYDWLPDAIKAAIRIRTNYPFLDPVPSTPLDLQNWCITSQGQLDTEKNLDSKHPEQTEMANETVNLDNRLKRKPLPKTGGDAGGASKIRPAESEIIEIKPGLWGISINIKEIWRRMRKKFRSQPTKDE